MPTKEITELRKAGKLEEAYTMAKTELEAEPDNIWSKRNISWVLYEYIKAAASENAYDDFIQHLQDLHSLAMPKEETMLFDNVVWPVYKVLNKLSKGKEEFFSDGQWLKTKLTIEFDKVDEVFNLIKDFHFTVPSQGYSLLHKGFMSCYKGTDKYLAFVDWWGIVNFREEDYQKEKLPNGKEIMSLAELVYTNYAKQIIPRHNNFVEPIFNKERALAFIPHLEHVVEKHPQFVYPAYYHAKLLIALGDKENLLSAILPFAKKKKNDFWVWDILSEAVKDDADKVLVCYCRALSCTATQEMLVKVRQRLTEILIDRQLFNEAKTEIEKIIAAKTAKGMKITAPITEWQKTEWYNAAEIKSSNDAFYRQHLELSDDLLYSDIEEESVLVTFVNSDKKILNFVALDAQQGFFKYERLLDHVNIGNILKVRFKNSSKDGRHLVHTAKIGSDDELAKRYLKEVTGEVKITAGKDFGFVGDTFVHPSLVRKHQLKSGMNIAGRAIKGYNPTKEQWSWKIISIDQ
jgi:hypothetical protein